jgi:N-acetylglucosamine-6-sulfatase
VRKLLIPMLLAVLACCVAGHSATSQATSLPAASRPNIVVVMTDDQTVESMRAMPQVQADLAQQGVTFENSFVTFPLCCPSRATFLTGQYPWNHHVLSNALPNGGYTRLDHSNTLPIWLQRAGYQTGYIGKYLNGYGTDVPPATVPPGWSEWYASVDPRTYFNYNFDLNENGALVFYPKSESNYRTDVYARKATDFISRLAPAAQPFFLTVGPLAPHFEGLTTYPNPRPAPRHEGAFANEPIPQTPAFNEGNVSDKPPDVRDQPRLGPDEIDRVTQAYRSRLASLLAVDEMVGDIVTALSQAGELDDTVIIFTSDNGYLLGEHRLVDVKTYPYEESIRVPLIIRGPGIPAGVVRSQPVANIDLAPTILDYAAANPGLRLDGVSLHKLIADPRLELGRGIGIRGYNFTAVRTNRYFYAEHKDGPRELYDLHRDPHELRSLHADRRLSRTRASLRDLLNQLRSCKGKGCRRSPNLKLRVRKGRGCNLEVAPGGKGPPSVRKTRFIVGKRSTRGAERTVTAMLTLRDGRKLTLSKRLPRRCR